MKYKKKFNDFLKLIFSLKGSYCMEKYLRLLTAETSDCF